MGLLNLRQGLVLDLMHSCSFTVFTDRVHELLAFSLRGRRCQLAFEGLDRALFSARTIRRNADILRELGWVLVNNNGRLEEVAETFVEMIQETDMLLDRLLGGIEAVVAVATSSRTATFRTSRSLGILRSRVIAFNLGRRDGVDYWMFDVHLLLFWRQDQNSQHQLDDLIKSQFSNQLPAQIRKSMGRGICNLWHRQ